MTTTEWTTSKTSGSSGTIFPVRRSYSTWRRGRYVAAATEPPKSGAVRGRADQMRAGPFRHRKVLLSLDALDMSKGIPQRLLALEALLEFRPEWRGRAILVLAARDRGRVVDAQLRKAVDGLVGHVNGRFGRADYCPVHYLKHTPVPKPTTGLGGPDQT